MDHDLRPGSNQTLLIGLTTLGIFAVVVLGAWGILGVDGVTPSEPELGEDPAESLERLTGTGGDTARVVRLGTISPELHENSGVAVSRQYEDVVWTHNDGPEGRLYSMRRDGTLIARIDVAVDGVQDWEDIDLGPCPGREGSASTEDCLYVADVGDNGADRASMSVVVLREPDPRSPGTVPALGILRFRYPDGPADTEALAVSPGGDLLLITKGTDGSGRLYRLSPDLDGPALKDAELMGPLPTSTTDEGDWITGAAVSPDGRTLAFRNHHAVFLTPLSDPLSAPTLCEIGLHQPQGEGIDYLDGERLLLTSEEEGGRAPIVRLRCP
jgi:hypothetical protein